MIPAGPGERILWGIIIVIVLGYLGGTWLNRQRSREIGRWLQSSLSALGGQPAWNLIGTMSSGVQLTVTHAARPFRQLQITYHMLTREFLPLWWFELIRGKRDLMAVRADLRGALEQEVEVVPFRGRLRRILDRDAREQPWNWRQAPGGLGVATREEADSALTLSVMEFLQRYGRYIERLSLRRRQPNLVMFVKLTGIERAPAADFLRALQKAIAAGETFGPDEGRRIKGEKAPA
jgi:hypothetical protein